MTSDDRPAAPDVTILLQQYRMVEERRTEFGRQFMQTTSFALPLFAAAVGLARPNPLLLRVICGIGGPFFFGLAVLGYRLGQRQDECGDMLAEIEHALRQLGHTEIVTLQLSKARFGARKLLALFLALVGIVFILVAIVGVRL